MRLPDSVRQRLKQAKNIVVFSGAGVSAESGIRTFRDGLQGLWAKYDPMQVATPGAFKANPQLVWDFYADRAEAARRASPNAGHRAIAQLATSGKNVTVITQNVDGLHQRAGSAGVLELHGNLFRLKPFADEDATFGSARKATVCPCCNGYGDSTLGDPYANRDDFEAIELMAGPVPKCPACEALLRPAVVWFGEILEPNILHDAISVVNRCDALICVGSSLEVEPAASLPYRALQHGAVVIEVNPQPTSLSEIVNASLMGAAGTVLPALLQEVWGITSK